LYYAKQGLITRKWNILHSENQRIGLQEQTKAMQCHPGNSFGANTPKNYITPEFVRSRQAEPSFQTTSTIPKANP
jgi:phosphomethylpyrimidine synthase